VAVAVIVAVAGAGAPADARPLPDLRPIALSAPASATVGESFVAVDRLANTGRGIAGRSTVGYFLSRDGRRDGGDLRLGRRAVKPIGPGGRSVGRKRLTMPADAAGSYRLLACADVLARVRERSERNNCVAAPGLLTAAAFEAPGGPNPGPGGPPGPDPGPPPPPPPPPPPAPQPTPEPPTLLAAGDIASCDSNGDEATAALLADRPGATVATLGDHVYGGATIADFNSCYDPSWGAARTRTHPTAGNHEYDDPGAAGYWAYFGAAAAERGKGWYGYELGAWHVVVLNSNCRAAGGCFKGSEQEAWLAADLAAHPARCTLAYWHHPLFTSDSQTGTAANTRPLWDDLYGAGAELVLNGHAHEYERFAPQRPDGAPDQSTGIREFVVGTGGRSFGAFGTSPAANSEKRDNSTFGVLSLKLGDGAYSWQFIPVAGGGFGDSGAQSCH
jgi:hypothetical protein